MVVACVVDVLELQNLPGAIPIIIRGLKMYMNTNTKNYTRLHEKQMPEVCLLIVNMYGR